MSETNWAVKPTVALKACSRMGRMNTIISGGIAESAVKCGCAGVHPHWIIARSAKARISADMSGYFFNEL